jgi:hypothetical protein
LGLSAPSISTLCRLDRIEGLLPDLSSHEHAELAAARRRIAQLETELPVTRRAADVLKEQAPRSRVRGLPDEATQGPGAGLLPGTRRVQSGFYAWRARLPSARAIRHA